MVEPLGAGDPRQVGAYRLLGRLGAGGMGRVYLGRTAGGRTVAVKLVRSELADDGEFRARFRHEVASARKVGGTFTAPVLDADTEGEHPWVATGYVPGPGLDAAVREFGPLPVGSVRPLGVGLADIDWQAGKLRGRQRGSSSQRSRRFGSLPARGWHSRPALAPLG